MYLNSMFQFAVHFQRLSADVFFTAYVAAECDKVQWSAVMQSAVSLYSKSTTFESEIIGSYSSVDE